MPDTSMEPASATERVISLDEAITMAIGLQKNNQLADAAFMFSKILDAVPEHPRALHYAGVLAHQQGRSDEAIRLLEKSLAIEPDQADGYSNLSIILRGKGRLDDAIAACLRAIEIDPTHANAHNNLGGLLRAQGRREEAEEFYRAAVALEPRHTDAYANLGNLLMNQGRIQEAMVAFCTVITLEPKHFEGRRRLAFAHTILGQIDKAIEIFQQWVDEEPANPIARHMLAACSGREVPARASDTYIESVFDSFAESFESRLAALEYRAPALVAAMVAEPGPAPASLDVLDAGCGTGLCGGLIRPHARRLVGVDLSTKMLDHAREKQVYDELAKDELTGYLAAHPGEFDVIVSADTLVYFGSLNEVLAAAAVALRPGGRVIFTVEELVNAAEKDFCIRPHGRYNHARGYVERASREAHLTLAIERSVLRNEGGAPVAGLLVRATKPAGDDHA
jgi:predicted TPR repeat methyltransferase